MASVVNSLLDSVVTSSLSQGAASPASSLSSAADEYSSSENASGENLTEEEALFNEIRSLSQELISGPWSTLRVRPLTSGGSFHMKSTRSKSSRVFLLDKAYDAKI